MQKHIVNEKIAEYLQNLEKFLIAKNNSYGNSLHEPNQTFFKGSVTDGICARIDDKLNRIKKVGLNDETEDTISDLIGYLIHLKIANENV